MNDWSAPGKSATGYWSMESGHGPSIGVLRDEFDISGAVASRANVLRLLAAEASDRLEYNWAVRLGRYDVEMMTPGVGGCDGWCSGVDGLIYWQECNSCGGEVEPDAMLARLHGKFLLEAAMKEGT